MLKGIPFPEHKDGVKSGVYVIVHPASDSVYVGSSNDLYARKANHESALRRGVSPNHGLQEAFDNDPILFFECIHTSTVAEAIVEEQRLLDQLKGNPLLLNIATDATSPARGATRSIEQREKLSVHRKGVKLSQEHIEKVRLANTGKKRTDEFRVAVSERMKTLVRSEKQTETLQQANARRARPISVNGVVYDNANEAAKVTGIHNSTIRQRAGNVYRSGANFPEYFYVDKE